MMKFLLGFISALIIGVVIYFTVFTKQSEKSYSTGFEKGLIEGVVKGIAQGKVEQKRFDDSLKNVERKNDSVHKKVLKPQPKTEIRNPYDKNYNVYGNKVGEER